MNQITAIYTCLALASTTAMTTHAAVFVLNPGGNGVDYAESDYSTGTRFLVGSSPLDVTHLGYWDYGADGIESAGGIEVGIYRVSDQQLIVSGTIASGTDAPLANGFRWLTLGSTVTLDANTQYIVASYNGSASDVQKLVIASEVTVNSTVTLQGAYYNFTPIPLGLHYPDLVDTWRPGADGNIGATFQFDVVPEPQTMLGAAGLGLILFAAWRRGA